MSEGLPAGARQVIRTLAALGLPGVSADELAGATGMPEPELRATLATLVRHGWLTTTRPGRYAVTRALHDILETAEAQEIRRRFGEFLLGGVRAVLRTQGKFAPRLWEHRAAATPAVRFVDSAEAMAWLGDHLESVVAAIRIGAQHGHYELAAQLAAALWEATPIDPRLGGELARWGEEAAIGWRNPRFLAMLVGHSARNRHEANDLQGAESQWVRALHIARRLEDHTLAVTALEALAALYQEWNRPHRKLDAEVELLAWQQRAGGELDVAQARVRLGSTMLAAGRARGAVEHFLQAEQDLDRLGEASAAEHAEVLIMLGRAHAQLGATDTARRCFGQALEIQAGRDPAAAEEIRELLDQLR